jgi:hypothetical protein
MRVLLLLLCSWLLSAVANSQTRYSIAFDGTNDYLIVPSASQINFGAGSSLTVEAWVRFNNSPSNYTGLVVKGGTGASWAGYQLVIVNNKLAAEFNNGGASPVTVTGSTNINDGNWHHVAMVKSNTNVKLYVDGVQDADATNSLFGNDLTNTANMYIGTERSPTLYFTGNIDEVRIWNTARTQTEIRQSRFSEIASSSSGLVACYRFNEGSGTTANDLVSSNNATLTNGPTWSSVVIAPLSSSIAPGNGLDFNGSNNQIVTSYSSALDFSNGNNLTIEAWVKPNTVSGAQNIVLKGDYGYGLILAGDKLKFWNAADYVASPISTVGVTANVWQHVAAVVTDEGSSLSVQFYIDGIPASSAITYSQASVNNGNTANLGLYIGVQGFGCACNWFNGSMDELRVWKSARTQAEIWQNMYSRISGSSSNLIAYYTFDQGSGSGSNSVVTSLIDQSTTGSNGTLSNFSLSGSTSNWVASTAYNTWTGASSTTWSTAGNWGSESAPTSSDNVVISSGGNQPVLIGNQSVKTVVLNTGATMSLGTNTLTMNGDLYNSGTISGTGKVLLQGSSMQYINGTGEVSNLELNNSSGATIGSTATLLTLTGTYTPTSGTLTTNGNLTLRSDLSGTARVAQGSGTYISGNVTVQRYVPSKSARKWSFVASPVSGTTIRSGWQDDVYITGPGTSGTICGTGGNEYNSNGFDATPTNTASMYTYNAVQVSGSRWVSVANTTSTNLTPGTGYRMNIRGTRANCNDQINNTGTPTAPGAVTLSVSGTLAQGTVNVPVYGKTAYNANGGTGNAYTLVGNPYASEVSLQSFYTANSTKISSSFWFYTPLNSSSTYCTYNTSTQQAANFPSGYSNGSGVTNVILASGQSFFVERTADANDNVSFAESQKVTTEANGNNFYRTQQVITDKIRVKFNKLNDTEAKDEIYINYLNDPTASLTEATQFDSYSFNTGNTHYLVSRKNGKSMAIQSRPAFTGNDTVSLAIKGDVGDHKLAFDEFSTFTGAGVIKLLDNFLNTETDIKNNPEYYFSITANAASQGADRFKIVFRSGQTLPVSYIHLSAEDKASVIQLNWTVGGEKDMQSYTVERATDAKTFSGIYIIAAKGNNGGNISYNTSDNDKLEGTIYYRVKAVDKNGKVSYSVVIKFQKGKSIALHTYPNPVKDQLNIVFTRNSNDKYDIRIINMHGMEAQLYNGVRAVNGLVQLNTSNLPAGNYIVEVITATGDRITERFLKQ